MRLLDARLDLDLRCNYKCIYCHKRTWADDAVTHFPADNLKKILPILNKYCYSVFLSCGGEPTLHPNFEEIMRDLVPQLLCGTDVFLVTNGFLLDKNTRAAILKSGISRVNISVDTVDSEIYSRLCGCAPNALDKVWGNIEALVAERGKSIFPKIFLTSVAMKSSIEKMPDVCERAVAVGLDGHRIQFVMPYDTTGTFEKENIANMPETRAALCKCRAILKRGGVYHDIPLSFADKVKTMIGGALFMKNKVEYIVSSAKKLFAAMRKPACRFDGRIIHIDAVGNIEFCERGSTQPGNLFDALEKNIRLDRFIKNTYTAMRKNGMKTCSAECPFLIR